MKRRKKDDVIKQEDGVIVIPDSDDDALVIKEEICVEASSDTTNTQCRTNIASKDGLKANLDLEDEDLPIVTDQNSSSIGNVIALDDAPQKTTTKTALTIEDLQSNGQRYLKVLSIYLSCRLTVTFVPSSI